MTPERIRNWLAARKPSGVQRLQLVAEGADSSDLIPIAEWNRADLDKINEAGDDITGEILTQAQEHTDAEERKTKFYIRYMGARDRVLRSVGHHASPNSKKDDLDSGVISDATIIRELMIHNREERKIGNAGHKASIEGLETVVAMQSKMILAQQALIESYQHREQDAAATGTGLVVAPEWTDEQREESIQRARAMAQLADKIPLMVELTAAAVAKKFGLIDGAGGDDGDEVTH